EYRETLDEAERRGGDLDPVAREKVERMDAELDRITAEIRQWTEREEREREANVARAAYAPALDAAASAAQRNAVVDFLRGDARALARDLSGVRREKAAIRAGAEGAELRDLVVGSATAGGATVPTSFLRELYDYLEEMSPIRSVARVIQTAGGENLEIPRVTA